MPYPNEHACRFINPDLVDVIGRQTVKHDGKEYGIITGKTKKDGKSVQQAFRYPKATWTAAAARAHCEEHGGKLFEPAVDNNRYTKDLLFPGTFPHPQRPEETITLTPKRLRQIAEESNRFLGLGGAIPVTISHPKDEVEKVTHTRGWLLRAMIDELTGKLKAEVDCGDEASVWIEGNQVATVSPGIVEDVVTAQGRFPVLIDHVALTNSPHLLGQEGFVPMMTSEQFKRGQIFFEGGKQGYVEYQKAEQFQCECIECHYKMYSDKHCKDIKCPKCDGDMRRVARPGPGQSFSKGGVMEEILNAIKALGGEIRQLFEKWSPEGDKTNKEKDMNELEELKGKYAALEKEHTTATEELDKLKGQISTMEAEAVKKKRTDFEVKVSKLEKDTKITPDEKARAMVTYDRISKDGDKIKVGEEEKPIEDFLLADFDKREPKTKTKLSHVVQNKEKTLEFDVSTLEGRNKFSDYVWRRAKAEDKDYNKMMSIVLMESGVEPDNPTE